MTCVLYHFPFHPASRAARLALGEARIEWTDVPVRPWEPDAPTQALNPSGMPPVLETAERGRPLVLCELHAIMGWVEDGVKGALLLPADAAERAEARRLVGWFERRFTDEVDAVLLHERVEKPLLKLGSPDAQALREGRVSLRHHLGVLDDLLQTRDWLAGRRLSQADLIAAAHLSIHDYFGEVAWGSWPSLKTWYMKLKSRPCFRPLLGDRFNGVAAAACYADLDF